MSNNPVIENIRKSLNRGTQTISAPRPAVYPSRQPGTPAEELELFLTEVKKLSAAGERMPSMHIGNALRQLVAEQNIRKATIWGSPLIQRLGAPNLLTELGVELIHPNADKHLLADCDLGISEADFLLPETGTLVLRSSAEKPRAVSLLPRIHLAIVQPHMLRTDLHQVFAETKNSPYLVFITGPSRTADIELTVTLGVHGPRNLYIWAIED